MGPAAVNHIVDLQNDQSVYINQGNSPVTSPVLKPIPVRITARPHAQILVRNVCAPQLVTVPLYSNLTTPAVRQSMFNPTLNMHNFKNRKGLGLVHWNIRSLIQNEKLDHLKIFISQADPDIMVLTESWLKQKHSDSEVSLNDYNLFRIDRIASGGGGVAIYVKACLSVIVLKAITIEKCFEFIALKVNLGPNNSLIIIGVYRPPSAKPEAIDKLGDLISPYFNNEMLILGDMNQDWKTNASDKLKEVCSNLNLTQLITEPTRPNFNNIAKSSLLDLILSNKSDKISASGVFELGITDHCPIACIRNTKLKKSQPRVIVKRNFKHFNEQAFMVDLQNSDILSTVRILDPDLALGQFTKTFNLLVNKHAPLKSQRIKNRSSPWYTPELSLLLREKNKAWSLARKSGDLSHWDAFRQIRNKYKASVSKAKSMYYVNNFSTCYSNPAKFWKLVKSTTKNNNISIMPTHLNHGQNVISSEPEICALFNNHFITAGHLFDNMNSANVTNSPETAGSTLDGSHGAPRFTLRPLTPEEVSEALFTIDTKKATGEDGLDPYFLLLAAPLISKPITHIFNQSILLSTIPKVWKVAHVVPLHKGGDKNDLNNYRPISKLSCLAKTLESLLSDQLKEFLSLHSLLSPNQSGFRANHSTVSAASLVLNDIVSAVDRHMQCAALFVDLSKAFDTVDHSLLLCRLNNIGCDSTSLKWFQNYLSDRWQCVKAEKARSAFLPISKGVPQGSILGPILFTIYINEIVKEVKDCSVHLYADDTVLYCSADTMTLAVNNLQIAFNVLQRELFDLKLVLNAEKTKYMLFTRAKSIDLNNFKISTCTGTQIERVQHYKYLGIHIDDKLTFKFHIENLARSLRAKLCMLYRNKACFPRFCRKRITEAVLLSVLDYGDVIYKNAAATTLKPLDAIYHSALRFITGDPYDTHHCTLYLKVGWPALSTRRDHHWFVFIYKALLNKAPPYISSLLQSNSSTHRTRSQNHIPLLVPRANTDLGKTAFGFSAPFTWNQLQSILKMDSMISLSQFKNLLSNLIVWNCHCFT